MKTTKPQKDGKYQTTGEENTSIQRMALNWLHTIKSLKEQRQLNGMNYHIFININTECQWTQLPHQKTPFDKQD
jgi:hypothetical protein